MGATLKDYIKEVENIVSKQILGTQWRPNQWKVPMKEGGEELSSVSLSNTKTRTFMTSLDPLIHFIFQHPEETALCDDWIELLNYYNPAIESLRKPT